MDSFIYPWLPLLRSLVQYFPWHMNLSHTSVKINHQASSATTLSPPSFIHFIYLLQNTFSLGKCMTASMKFILPTLSFHSYMKASCNINIIPLLLHCHPLWCSSSYLDYAIWKEEERMKRGNERDGERRKKGGHMRLFSNIFYVLVY